MRALALAVFPCLMFACANPAARIVPETMEQEDSFDEDDALSLSAAGGKCQPELADLWARRAGFRMDRKTGRMGGFGTHAMHFISPLRMGNQWFVYYIHNGQGEGSQTGLAITKDGVNFDDKGVVIRRGGWHDKMAAFSHVLKQGSNFHLVFEGSGGGSPGDIGYARSRDGKNFNVDAEPLLKHGGGWESANIGTPSLWLENGTWYLFYHGFDGNKVQIGVATGPNLRNLTKHSTNPLLEVGDSEDWDSGTVGWRSIRKEGRFYYMVYEGSTKKVNGDFGKSNWSSGIARSRDLIHWQKFSRNPVLPPTHEGFGRDGPAFLQTDDGKLHVYYRDGGTRRATLTWYKGKRRSCGQ